MAGLAWCKDAAMIESCAAPAVSGVTVIAYVTAGDMACMFAGCAASVMTEVAFQWRALEHSPDVAA